MPSRIEPGTAKVAAIASPSPLLKSSMYWCTAAIGSVVATSFSFWHALNDPSLRCCNILPEVFQALIASEQYAEDSGVCQQHITRSVAARRHPEEHIELPVPRFCERMRPGHIDRLSGQNMNGPGVIGCQCVVRQVHMEIEVCYSLEPAFGIQVFRDGQGSNLFSSGNNCGT